MKFKTEYKNETISEWDDNYGAGGAFPDLAPIIESVAEADLAMHLFPEIEDLDQIMAAHKFESRCPEARAIEASNRGSEEYHQIGDGEYPVTVTVDGVEHQVIVTIAW